MKELNKKEMLEIGGGTSISATMVSAVYKLVGLVYEVGQALGSYIRRETEGKMCDI